MQLIPRRTLRKMFQESFHHLHLDSDQRLFVDVEEGIKDILLIQGRYIKLAKKQKKEHPELTSQSNLKKMVNLKVEKKIKEDLARKLAPAA